MVKILSGGAMVLIDALTCAYTLADATSQSMLWGSVVLSVATALPFVGACADGWFNTLSGLSATKVDDRR